jgi:hypothetical protein
VSRFWTSAYWYDLLAAVVCAPLFVVALVGGLGWRSLVILGAAVFWAVLARFDRQRAQAAARHRELRRRRLDRESAETWNGPRRG